MTPRDQRRRAFRALDLRREALSLRDAGTPAGLRRAWWAQYRAEAWEALAAGDSRLARSYRGASNRQPARAFA